MQGEKAINTSLPAYTKLSHDECPQTDVGTAEMYWIPYASVVGSLWWLRV